MSTTCKFFLQGTCKFGDNCKYSHQINDNIQSQGTSVMRQQSKPPTIDTNLLIKSVITDMNNAEKGGHWLLSSYAPFKDKPCFPGFENRSFEEVRCGYYEAMKNGTVEQYKVELQSALQEAAMKMKVLQNPTNEIVSMLIQIYNTPVNNQFSTGGFLSTSQPNPTFIQNQQPASSSQSIFAAANQKLFGNAPSQQQSIFGGSQANPTNIFTGTQPATNNIFGSPLPHTVNKSIFGGGQTMIGNQQTFGNNQNNAILGSQAFETNPPLHNQNPFVGQNQTNAFATQNNFGQPNNAFSSQMQNTPFNVPTHTNSPFNQGQPTSNSIFAVQNQQPNYANLVNPVAPSPFTGQVQQSIFTTSPIQQTTSPFAQQPSNSGSNLFNIQTPTTVLGGQTSIFGNQPASEQKLTNSIFAQTPSMGNSVFGGVPEVTNSDAYSKLEDLSENEIRSFESDSFEFGKIPEKPPTAQMCL